MVSGGELGRVMIAGGRADRTVFAGVGKTDEEIAAGSEGRGPDVQRRERGRARRHRPGGRLAGQGRSPVALRVNPDVDPKTHKYISTGKKESKFGMDIDRSLALAGRSKGLEVGVDDRRPHAHRLADHDGRAHAGAAGKAVDIIAQLRGWATRSPGSTWAGGSGSVIGAMRRSPSRNSRKR